MTVYKIPLTAVIFLFPVVALFITIPYIIYEYHKYGSINKFRTLIIYSFILYLMAAYFFVILPLPKLNDVKKPEVFMNLIPFSFIKDFIRETSFQMSDLLDPIKIIKSPSFYTPFFNIILTLPFGIYLRYYFKKNFKKTCIYTFLLSLFFELTQLSGLYFIYKYPYRLFDIDDLILNTLGGMIGYLGIGLFVKYLPSREKIDEDSIAQGKKVSGLRRLTVFFLDTTIYVLIYNIFKNTTIYNLKIPMFVVYYGIIPAIKNGKTLGSSFLNVKFVYESYTPIMNVLRTSFIWAYYFFLPIKLFMQIGASNLTPTISILLVIPLIVILLFCFLSNLKNILLGKRIFYDRIFKVNFKSTIEE